MLITGTVKDPYLNSYRISHSGKISLFLSHVPLPPRSFSFLLKFQSLYACLSVSRVASKINSLCFSLLPGQRYPLKSNLLS